MRGQGRWGRVPHAAGEFHAHLNTWEQATLDAELARDDFVGWLRNVDRKDWALQIPYRDAKGIYRPLYHDFLVFRYVAGEIVIDIIDPHDPTRQDAVPKAKGLAEYAEHHGARFGRIEIIIKDGDKLLRLDLTDRSTRQSVLVVGSSDALSHLYQRMQDVSL